ncbi:serine/threonine-protein kinase, partial [Cellulomonas sp. ICMP 17802]|uniref:serine/threonine-protein kinase n=1 Tax=Cellulomonas sp. ICMP 17802 TaxID=3239199 RepID=UPI00351BAE31
MSRATGAGRLVAGRYRLGREIGSGRSAQVHRAVDERLGRAVALKLLRPGMPSGGLLGAAALDHPHLVHVLDAGVDDGRAFVVLELVHGVTVDQLVECSPRPAEALAVVAAVLAGLAHAHEQGVLHLDVSPANVLVPVRRGRPDASGVVVLDVGGARVPGPADAVIAVSPPYTSPELATASGADARSDVYAAGALLFHLLTGREPFPRAQPRDVLLAHVHEPPPVPSALVPGLPAEVDAVVLRAMAKAPEDRFGSAAAMRDAVLAAAELVRGAESGAPDRRPSPRPVRTTRELPPTSVMKTAVPM